MADRFSRTKLLIGSEALARLNSAHVAVFGLGGVGSFAVEALARAGVGRLTVVDADTVNVTNINRQLIATEKTVGMAKTRAVYDRVKDISADIDIIEKQLFFSAETASELDFGQFDYIIDAIDTVTAKLLLVETANRLGIPIISSMGTGNKLDPTKFEISDIYKTSVCPLARVMRTELKKRGIKSLKVLFSTEKPREPLLSELSEKAPPGRRAVPASISFVPPAAGLIIAGEVIKDICKIQ